MIKYKAKTVSAIALIIVTVGFAITYGVNWWAALSYPNAIEYEGPMLWAANALTHSQNIYDPERLINAPWAVITYPPLYLCLGSISNQIIRAVLLVLAINNICQRYRMRCFLLSSASPVRLFSTSGSHRSGVPCRIFTDVSLGLHRSP